MHFEAELDNGEFHTNTEGYVTTKNGKDIYVTYNIPHDLVSKLKNLTATSQITAFLRTCDRNNFLVLAYIPRSNLLYAANDHFGSNEILYKVTNSGIYLTDSIHHLKKRLPKLELNLKQLNESLAFRLVNPPNTVFRDVYSVPIASVLFYQTNKKTTVRTEYWNPTLELGKKNYNYVRLTNEVQAGLVASAKQEKDRASTMGVSLSGGVDSGGLLSLLHNVTNKDIRSISVGPHGPDSYDLISARKTAIFNNSPQIEKYSSYDDFGILPKYVCNLSQPQDGQVLLLYSLIFEGAQEVGISRIVFGHGPDHMLGGQKYSRLALWLKKISFLPQSTQRFILHNLGKVAGFTENQKQILETDSWLQRFFLVKSMNFWKERPYLLIDKDPFELVESREAQEVLNRNDIDTIDKMVYLDWKLIQIYNRNGTMNKMGRPFGVTVFTPAYTILGGSPMFHVPNKYRKLEGWDKKVYRDAMREFIPPHLYNNPRRGLVMPLIKWFNSSNHPFKKYLMDSEILHKIYDVEKFYAEYDDTKEAALSVVRLLSLALWHDMHFTTKGDKDYMTAYHKSRELFDD